jgi:hypothetical protein
MDCRNLDYVRSSTTLIAHLFFVRDSTSLLDLSNARLRILSAVSPPIHILEPQLLRLHTLKQPDIDNAHSVEEPRADAPCHTRAAAGWAEVMRHFVGGEGIRLHAVRNFMYVKVTRTKRVVP